MLMDILPNHTKGFRPKSTCSGLATHTALTKQMARNIFQVLPFR